MSKPQARQFVVIAMIEPLQRPGGVPFEWASRTFSGVKKNGDERQFWFKVNGIHGGFTPRSLVRKAVALGKSRRQLASKRFAVILPPLASGRF